MTTITHPEAAPRPQPKPIKRSARTRLADPSAGRPHNWSFGPLTEAQIRARTAFEAAMRAGRLARVDMATVEAAPWPMPGAL